jgi:hypothetical protein
MPVTHFHLPFYIFSPIILRWCRLSTDNWIGKSNFDEIFKMQVISMAFILAKLCSGFRNLSCWGFWNERMREFWSRGWKLGEGEEIFLKRGWQEIFCFLSRTQSETQKIWSYSDRNLVRIFPKIQILEFLHFLIKQRLKQPNKGIEINKKSIKNLYFP